MAGTGNAIRRAGSAGNHILVKRGLDSHENRSHPFAAHKQNQAKMRDLTSMLLRAKIAESSQEHFGLLDELSVVNEGL